MRNCFKVDFIIGLLIVNDFGGLHKTWNVVVFEDGMYTQLLSGTFPEAIRVYMGLESLSFVQHMLIPCEADSLCVFNVWHSEYGAHLVSDFDWTLYIENLVSCLPWIAIGGKETVIAGCLSRLHQVVHNALPGCIAWKVPQDDSSPTLLTEAATVVCESEIHWVPFLSVNLSRVLSQ